MRQHFVGRPPSRDLLECRAGVLKIGQHELLRQGRPGGFAAARHRVVRALEQRDVTQVRDGRRVVQPLDVERPDDIAQFLLVRAAPDSADSLVAWQKSTRTVGVRLPRKVPVHVLYWTAWVDPKGIVQFRDDVYGIDRRLREALDPAHPSAFRLNVWTHGDSLGT